MFNNRPITNNWTPRLFVTPTTGANARAANAPAAMKSNLVSVNVSLRHAAELVAEIGHDKLAISLRIALSLAVEHKVPACYYVLVVFEPVLSKHPHELGTPFTDPEF